MKKPNRKSSDVLKLSAVRLARFLNWATRSVPGFIKSLHRHEVWCQNYQDSYDPVISLAAKCFQIGLNEEMVNEVLKDRPTGNLGIILFGGKRSVLIDVVVDGLTLSVGIKNPRLLATTALNSAIRDSISFSDFDSAFFEMAMSSATRALEPLRDTINKLSDEQCAHVLSGSLHISKEVGFRDSVIQKINEINFDLSVPITLSYNSFSIVIEKKIQPKLGILLDDTTFQELKTAKENHCKNKFSTIVNIANDFDLNGFTKDEFLQFFEIKSHEIRNRIKRQRDKIAEARTVTALLKDPRFSQYHQLYPARTLTRTWTAYLGPTNSGKTHAAIEALIGSQRAIYLSPLRLMALENQERIEAAGVPCSLVTGEEQIIRAEANHFCCTVEMFAQFKDLPWDVVVIDEVQMLTDPSRGWAWIDAMVSAYTERLIVTGPKYIAPSLIKLSSICGDVIEVVDKERLTPIKVAERPVQLKDLEKGSLLIAFSRKTVLTLKRIVEASGQHASVVYGGLSPEVRREQTRRFREGETDIMVATDAVGMGLNLPATTVCFYTDEKYDGVTYRSLTSKEIKQIGGRAGRYGLSEGGVVTALDKITLKSIARAFKSEDHPLTVKHFNVRPGYEHLEKIAAFSGENSLLTAWGLFVRNVNFGAEYISILPVEMSTWIEIIDNHVFPLRLRWIFANAPIKGGFDGPCAYTVKSWLPLVANGKTISLPTNFGPCSNLETMEGEIHIIEAYLSLSRSLEYAFPDVEDALKTRDKLNVAVNRYLSKSIGATNQEKNLLVNSPSRCKGCRSTM